MIKKILGCLLGMALLWGFNEDEMLNNALDAIDAKEYSKARDMYLVIFEESGKIEYLRESILVSSLLEDPEGTINLVRLYHQKEKKYDIEVEKVLADSYLKLGDVKNSIITIEKIKTKESTPLLHEILGSLYLQSNRQKDALKELNKAYDESHSERSLDQLITIYSNMQNNGEIGELLGAHLEKYGCSAELCKRSIEFYIKTNQISKVEKLLEKMESQSPTIQNATNLIAIYAYQKKFDQALKIAKKYPLNRSIILELYVGKGDFASASEQSMLIYNESKNPENLIMAQVYKFEAFKKTLSKQELEEMVLALKKGIKELKEKKDQNRTTSYANYLNFLGYLLIDCDLNPKEGIVYIKEALAINPDDFETIDSLAWGYYKIGECQKAYEVISKIPQEKIELTVELKEHLDKINSCKNK